MSRSGWLQAPGRLVCLSAGPEASTWRPLVAGGANVIV
jgi:hypothetical protein